MVSESFILAIIAELGIIALAVIFDAEYVQLAFGALMGMLGGYGIAKRSNSKGKGSRGKEAS